MIFTVRKFLNCHLKSFSYGRHFSHICKLLNLQKKKFSGDINRKIILELKLSANLAKKLKKKVVYKKKSKPNQLYF